MMEDSKSTKLIWVSPSTSNAPVDRSKLRREVMQKLASKRKGPKRYHPNGLQLPIFLQGNLNESTTNQGKDKQEAHAIESSACCQARVPDSDVCEFGYLHLQTSLTQLPISPNTYASLLVKSNLNFLDLSLLASLEVGRYTGQRLLEDPQNISHFLGGKNWSYCSYVPFHYDESALVRHATDCVVARLRGLLTPMDKVWESLAVSSYLKALSHLQGAINSNSQYLMSETLLATQILGLYELLNPNRGNAWINHAAGAACILKLRGSNSHNSELEKCLLLSHTGPMITEAIMKNESCFLERPNWTAALQDIITDDPRIPERSTMVISILTILASIPRLFKDVTKVICDGRYTPLAALAELISRAERTRSSLQNWYSSHIEPDGTPLNRSCFCKRYDKVMTLFYICSIYSNRLSTCIYWTGTQGVEEIEQETQKFAKIIVSLFEEKAYSNFQSSLLLAQKLPIAEATIKSARVWKKQLHHSKGQSQRLLFKMPKQTFEGWCSLLGRKTS